MYIAQCNVYNANTHVIIHHIAQFTPCNVHCTMYNIRCTVYDVQCTMYILYSVHCVNLVRVETGKKDEEMKCINQYFYYVWGNYYSRRCFFMSSRTSIVQCTVYIVQCTLYTVRCTMYTVHCTVYALLIRHLVYVYTLYVYTLYKLHVYTLHSYIRIV